MTKSLKSMVLYRVFLLILHILLLWTGCDAKKNHLCPASSCGEVRNISYPFRLKGDPKHCGRSEYELTCEDNRTVLYLYPGRYYVKLIDYSFNPNVGFYGRIQAVDDGLQKGNCLSLPRYASVRSNLGGSSPPYYPTYEFSVVFVKCSQPITSALYIDTKPCIDGAHSADPPPNFSKMKEYSYAVQRGSGLKVGDIKDSCTITMTVLASDFWRGKGEQQDVSPPYKDLHNMMAEGFDLNYDENPPSSSRAHSVCFLGFGYARKMCLQYSYYNSVWGDTANLALNTISDIFALIIYAKFVFGAPCVLMFLTYKWRRRHQAMDPSVEEFLQANNNFLPIRMVVMRAMSEVATIGRIHHVNVVQLVGYCFDYSKQALVYDFMPNGFLDKHIFSRDYGRFLDHKKIYEISLGVAKGIEYLHRGCDMQILHFDIKPHNILLDQNFTPKVSDFGLARLYPANHNIVSLIAARGTLGYMVPELFYKDIGGVSHKADVYSFGMLLMEMAGRRRNVNANIEHSSQIYFPLWVYDQLSKENEVEVEEVEEEREITRKMVIVALWCIQLMPDDRPPMRRVLDMLEGDIDKLRLPPKPLLYPSEKPVDDVNIEKELESFSTSSSAPTTSDGYRFQNNNKITESCSV